MISEESKLNNLLNNHEGVVESKEEEEGVDQQKIQKYSYKKEANIEEFANNNIYEELDHQVMACNSDVLIHE